MPSNASQGNKSITHAPVSVPATGPSKNLSEDPPIVHPSSPAISPIIQPSAPQILPPSTQRSKKNLFDDLPIIHPSSPATSPIIQPSAPEILPPSTHHSKKNFSDDLPVIHPSSPATSPIIQPSAPEILPPSNHHSKKNLSDDLPIIHPSSPATSPIIRPSAPEILPPSTHHSKKNLSDDLPIIHPSSPATSPIIQPSAPEILPPSTHHSKKNLSDDLPIIHPSSPATSPIIQPSAPEILPPSTHHSKKNLSDDLPIIHPSSPATSPIIQPSAPEILPRSTHHSKKNLSDELPIIHPSSPATSPIIQPSAPEILPPSTHHSKKNLSDELPIIHPSSPATSPIIQPSAPEILPPSTHHSKKNLSDELPIIHPSSPATSPIIQPSAPEILPPSTHHSKKNLSDELPIIHPSSPATSPIIQPSAPEILPPSTHHVKKNLSDDLPIIHPSSPATSPIIQPSAPEILPPNTHHSKKNSLDNLPTVHSSSPAISPIVQPGAREILPPSTHHSKKNFSDDLPIIHPSSPATSPIIQPGAPEILPPSTHHSKKNLPDDLPIIHPSSPAISPIIQPSAHEILPPSIHHGKENFPEGSPIFHPSSPATSPIIHPSAPEISPPSTHHSKRNLPDDSPIIRPSSPATSPIIHPSAPQVSPPSTHHSYTSFTGAPVPKSVAPGPDISHASTPLPSIGWKKNGIPVGAPPDESTPLPSIGRKKDGIPVAAPPDETLKALPPANHSPARGSFSFLAPSTHKAVRQSNDASVPSLSSPTPINKEHHSPASSPSIPFHWWKHARTKVNSPAPSLSPLSSKQRGPVISPSFLPTNRRTHYASPPLSPGSSASASHYPISTPVTNVSPAPSPSPTVASGWTRMPVLPPRVSPSGSSSLSPPLPHPVQALPPPPPNEDCSAIVCVEPYANTPPGSPCGCVLPMQVGLQLTVALYTFFPLVSELAQEIAAGVFMKQSQVRIMGANAASQQPEKTIVLIDLVPLGKRFDNTTAFLTYQRFWHKKVAIKSSFFGDYEVLYVRYPGLPPSPPSASSGITIIDNGPYSGNDNNARAIKPLGVDVRRRQQKDGLGGGIVAIIALSASVALILCSAVAWVLLVRHRGRTSQSTPTLRPLPPSIAKPSGTTASMVGSGLSSASLSFGSSIAPYAGSAKTFSTIDIERATNNFDASRILGEGGFGLVYSGTLEDGTKVAVKVLKRDDRQGDREFLAEVEMLSRLHHRNLVKLIGICTEERARCLVYELIPNGSVESHLHGADKEPSPLDWDARIKIALGAARGLAYLHEDSSPRVIHRDFKASNILLEHDFTPKVSDFGLARTALDEENRHISTRVMGTFGYVAPEYAMTGHLLVKSDVYSYGVVLLELLTGRKPVDMSQPPGQENLVAWARPLLTSREGLEMIIDTSLGPDIPFDSVAKVAAIASMCVQPEVSHRPFMGEVVQALKLVCNECDEAKEVGSESSSRDLSVDMDAGVSAASGHLQDPFQNETTVPDYDSEPDIERGISMSGLFSTSVRYGSQASGSFRRYSSSGPLRTGRGRQLWQRMRRLAGESASEHEVIFKQWPGSH
ncbi:hypothetical protein MANES_03G034100v8 [Manihot esculenta]|uniref:Uncharacterized protein n=2 Tax=Manihot esculenta TaxID=3983 RepID=A0ACB7I1V0_MANES|nr:hypothetical protein MANES_03G034100v8 [Manihot esculenta]